jgi:AcrR family transcriptional regulator
MSRQADAEQSPRLEPVHVCTDDELLDAAVRVIEEFGYRGLTLERLAVAAGTSRMTLHRRDTTLAGVVAGLSLRAAAELRDAFFPILTATRPADQRLRAALDALCDVADRHLALLAGLFADDAGVFHAPPDETGALPTDEAFVAPFAKLLADGELDGTLQPQPDTTEAATVLFNTAGWGYVQLRHAQRWPPERARDGVLRLVMTGLTTRPSSEPSAP